MIGRDTVVVGHHFDIRAVSVLVIFANCLRISCSLEHSCASPAIIRILVGLVTRVWGTNRSPGQPGTGMAIRKGISVGWEAW